MKLKTVSKWLVVLGALEVGLMGLMGNGLISSLLASWPMFVRVLYILIGAAGVWGAYAMGMKLSKK